MQIDLQLGRDMARAFQTKPYRPMKGQLPGGTLLFTGGDDVYRCDLPSLKSIKLEWPENLGGHLINISGPHRGIFACEYYLDRSVLLRKDPKDSRKCLLLKDLGRVTSTSLSDDGNWVAYYRANEQGDSSLCLYDLGTGKEQRIAGPCTGCRLSWTRDSRTLCCGISLPKAKLPKSMLIGSTRGFESDGLLVTVGLLDIRTKRYLPALLGFQAILAGDDKSLWVERDVLGSDARLHVNFKGETIKGTSLAPRLSDFLGWTSQTSLLSSAQATEQDKPAAAYGQESDITECTAIRYGTFDGEFAAPLVRVNAIIGWQDPARFAAAYSSDKW